MNIIQTEAARLVQQVMDGGNLDQALQDSLRRHSQFTAQQRGALQDLSYGTVRHFGLLQFCLDRLLTRAVRDPWLGYLILVALYQLEFSKSAAHAIVDHAVRAAKQRNPATGALVNAVLRNFQRRRSELLQLAESDPASRYSYPRWWVALLQRQYGDKTAAILEAGNMHPPMTLRVNSRHCSAMEYQTMLAQENMAARIVEPGALILEQPVPVERLPEFAAGWVSVQDAGAQYAAWLLDAAAGMRVLDACAAPGGKAAHLLERADIELVAVDKDAIRLQRVQQNLLRIGRTAKLVCGDAATPGGWWDGKSFQRILADVPCSASGVVRRHPDIKWLRRPTDIERFARQQSEILEALWPLLEAGGRLLYATCSIFSRENGEVIERFLGAHPEAEMIDVPSALPRTGQLLPNEQHDGFFYALLHKKF